MMMNRKFNLNKNPYGKSYNIHLKEEIEINQGVTVLVGCNGYGKSTLITQIKEQLIGKSVPYIEFNNIEDGGANARERAALYNNFDFVVVSVLSSEGENIMLNMNNLAVNIGNFVRKEEQSNERWILLDGIDSGLSIDNIAYIKECLFKILLKYNFGRDIYIIVSTNNYEIARNEQCFDVCKCEYITFNNYEDYRNMIIKSREIKESRYKD
jgi:hypothetical protein